MKTFLNVRAGGTFNYHCAERATPCLPVATHVSLRTKEGELSLLEGARGLEEMSTVYTCRYEIQESRYPEIVIETDASLPEQGDATGVFPPFVGYPKETQRKSELTDDTKL
jgi:hypothetical protein